ncbi:hypothetical protein CCYA_CCYA01G0390 [Cyanidiococcus yangmingshanensis]|nr:hypothetical protein CCYA_CCYA01G0390 [Cyanidiococcus yangmingshanensis]
MTLRYKQPGPASQMRCAGVLAWIRSWHYCLPEARPKRPARYAISYRLFWAALPLTVWWALYSGYPGTVPLEYRRPVQELCLLPNLDRALQRMLSPISPLLASQITVDLSCIRSSIDPANLWHNETSEVGRENGRVWSKDPEHTCASPERCSVADGVWRFFCEAWKHFRERSRGMPQVEDFLACLLYSLHALLPFCTGMIALGFVSIRAEGVVKQAPSLASECIEVSLDLLSSYGWLSLVAIAVHLWWPMAPPWFVFMQTGTIWPSAEQCASPAMTRTRLWYRTQRTGSAARLILMDRWLGFPIYENLFKRNRWVFAAFPSLHVATPAWMALKIADSGSRRTSNLRTCEKLWLTMGRASTASGKSNETWAMASLRGVSKMRQRLVVRCTVLAWLYTFGVSWSALYLGHHYVVDCIGGVLCACIAELCHKCYWRWSLRKHRGPHDRSDTDR